MKIQHRNVHIKSLITTAGAFGIVLIISVFLEMPCHAIELHKGILLFAVWLVQALELAGEFFWRRYTWGQRFLCRRVARMSMYDVLFI